MATINFYDWSRPALLQSARYDGPDVHTQLDFTLSETPAAGGEARETAVQVDLKLASAADVKGLANGALSRRYPAERARDVEPTRLALAEFADPALPWLYTPEPGAGGHHRPWLVLVVGRESTREETLDVTLHAGGDPVEVTLEPELLNALPLSESHAWAHVQKLGEDVIGRLLCPLRLEPNSDYLAVLVPAFRREGEGWVDAWPAGAAAAQRLQAYAHWRFRTGDSDDFLALARALTPQLAPPGLGRTAVRYPRTPLEPRLVARGALTGPPTGAADAEPSPDDPWPPVESLPEAIEEDLANLQRFGGASRRDERGRPIITLPRHGEPWSPIRDPHEWAASLNSDPRNRGAAGLGNELGVVEQERLVELAMTSLGPLREAEQRVRHLALGVSAARSLWNRRLPATAAERIALLGPAMPRIMTQHGPLADVATGPGRPLARSMFTSAAKRVLRRGPARTALAQASASDESALLEASNTCPVAAPDPSGLVVAKPEPFDFHRVIDGGSLLAQVDPSRAATADDAARLENLRRAVTNAVQGSLGPAARWQSDTQRSATSVRLQVMIPGEERDGPLGPGIPQPPRLLFVDVTLVGISTMTDDWLEVRAAAGGGEEWQLDASVGTTTLTLSSAARSASLHLTPRPADRVLVVVLELSARRATSPGRQGAGVSLAPHLFKVVLTPRSWSPDALDGTIEIEVSNPSSRHLRDATLEVPGAALPIAIDAPPGMSRTHTQAVSVRAASDGVTATAVVGGVRSGSLRLDRPAPRSVSYATTPWLLPFALATSSAAGGSGEAERLWNQLRGWAHNADASDLDEWGANLEGTPWEGLDADALRELGEMLHGLPQRPPSAEPPCRTVNLVALDLALTEAFDPTGPNARAIRRVNSTIAGRPEDAGLEPIGVCPSVPLPVWELLREHRGDWLLPGSAELARDAVVGLSTNQAFVEAIMVGINQQLVSELSWRGLPIPPGCSPLRHFWGRVAPASGRAIADITPIAGWRDTPIAHRSHRETSDADSLVVMLRTELFHRYPATIVSLLPAGADPSRPDFGNPDAHAALPRQYPTFQGSIGDDIHFFGFSVTPELGRGHWFVLEEPPKGFRFWSTKGDEDVLGDALRSAREGGQSGSHVAQRTFANPIRVLIRGDELLPAPEMPR